MLDKLVNYVVKKMKSFSISIKTGMICLPVPHVSAEKGSGLYKVHADWHVMP